MGLHSISEDATMVTYNCADPECSHHNCAGWEDFRECEHHDAVEPVLVPAAEMKKTLMASGASLETLANIGDMIVLQPRAGGRVSGQTHQIPVDHPDVQFSGPSMVALPRCTGTHPDGSQCTTQMFVKVNFSAKEMKAENITKPIRDDPTDPTRITRFQEHPMVARHKKLGAKLRAIGKDYQAPTIPAPASLVG